MSCGKEVARQLVIVDSDMTLAFEVAKEVKTAIDINGVRYRALRGRWRDGGRLRQIGISASAGRHLLLHQS